MIFFLCAVYCKYCQRHGEEGELDLRGQATSSEEENYPLGERKNEKAKSGDNETWGM